MFTDAEVPFRVVVDSFAEKYYIKDFQKKHKTHWPTTRKAIVAQLNNIDLLLKYGRLTPPIYVSKDKRYAVHKHSFAIAGTKQSAKTSGNRIILYIDYELRTVYVLLVYSKNHISPPNETGKWESVVSKQFPDIFKNF